MKSPAFKNSYLYAAVLLGLASGLQAQFTTTASTNAATMANTLIGGAGISITSASYTGTSNASGFFSGATQLPFTSGVILTTGSVTNAVGPNSSSQSTSDNGASGDADLDTLVGLPTHDASVLTMTFTAQNANVSFQYVFASEEYNEYVGKGFNDVFAFYLNGVNIALLPNSAQVDIDTVNSGLNSTYFTDNTVTPTPLSMFQYDGFVGVSINLYATGMVNLFGENTIKLAIADSGDHLLDSAVFIGEGTFRNELPPVAVPEPSTYALAGAASLFGLSFLRRFRAKRA